MTALTSTDRIDEQLNQVKVLTMSSAAQLRAELNQHDRSMLQWTIGAILTAGALGVAIGQLQAS